MGDIGRDKQSEPDQPADVDLAARIATVVDPLLADVWAFTWTRDAADMGTAELGVLLRMAYLQGYRDALEEEVPGEVLRRLGANVPAPRQVRRSSPRRPRP